MEREIDLQQVSDGKRYLAGDMVKAGCNGCKGCFQCCTGMGESIVLDPYDIYQLTGALQMDFTGLLQQAVELQLVDGVILPNLKMQGEQERCFFLNEEGRCSVHSARPGFCRMFPLGRIYEEDSFQYFLQIRECPYPGKTKVKIKKWLEIPRLSEYERFICDWHFFIKRLGGLLRETEREESVKSLNMYMLGLFYQKPYVTEEDFYDQFQKRLSEACSVL